MVIPAQIIIGSFRPAFFYVSETRKCGNVFGKPFSGAVFIQRTLSRISTLGSGEWGFRAIDLGFCIKYQS